MPVGIELLFTAQDQAAEQAVARLGRGFDDLNRRATTTTQTFSQTGRQVRLLAGEITTELNPALGNIVSRATQAGGAVQGMGVAAGLALTAVVAATAGMAAYIRTLDEAATRQAQLNLAVRSLDSRPITAQLAEISQTMEQMRVRGEAWIGSAMNLFRTFTDWIGVTTAETEKLAKAQAASLATLPVDKVQMLTEGYRELLQAQQALVAVEIQRATQSQNLGKIVDLYEDLEGALIRVAHAEEKLLEIERQRAVETAKANNQPQARIDALNESFEVRQQALQRRVRAQVGGTRLAGQTAFFAGFSAQLQRDVEGAGSLEQITDSTLAPDTAVRLFERRRQLAQEQLQVEQQRAQILTTIVGLTESERAAAALVAIEAERRLKFAQANNDAAKEDLANFEALIQRMNVERAERERTNAAEGLAKGFRDAAEEAEASGKILEATARNTARTMQQAFSDQFFAVITGDFKKLPDLGKAFALAMVRNVTDALAQMGTAPILRALGGGGMRGVVPFGTVGAGAAATGTLIQTPGGPAVLSSTGTISQVGVGSNVTTAGIFPGGGLGNLPVSSIFNLFSSGGLSAGAALTGADVAALSGAGLSASEIAGVAALSGPSIAQTAGITLGEALGAAGAVVGFGFSLYSAYQSGSPTMGAVTGGVSGAVAGATIGSLFPVIGTVVGAVVGLAVGAAAGAGAGAAGKPDMPTRREGAETSESLAGVAGEVANAGTFNELYQVILKHTSPAFGGRFPGRVDTDSGRRIAGGGLAVSFIDAPSGKRLIVGRGAGLAGVTELRRLGQRGDVSTIRARPQAGISESELQAIGGPIEQALAQKVQRLAAIEANAFFAIRERFASPGVAAGAGRTATYERETFLPLSRAGEAAGRDVFVNADLLAAGGMTDNEIEAFYRELIRVAGARGLGYITPERFAF